MYKRQVFGGRRDFNQFVRACAEYGREDIDKICQEVEGKKPDEVRRTVCDGGLYPLLDVQAPPLHSTYK